MVLLRSALYLYLLRTVFILYAVLMSFGHYLVPKVSFFFFVIFASLSIPYRLLRASFQLHPGRCPIQVTVEILFKTLLLFKLIVGHDLLFWISKFYQGLNFITKTVRLRKSIMCNIYFVSVIASCDSGWYPHHSRSFGAWEVRVLKSSEAQIGGEECCGFTLRIVWMCVLHM